MKKTLILALTSTLLVACDDDNDFVNINISEDSYAVQMVAADYGSSQVAVGNVIGDRTAIQGLMAKDKSDYTIDTYKNNLHHIGKFSIDTIDTYTADSSVNSSPVKNFPNDDESGSANTYRLVQTSVDTAFLIRNGYSSVLIGNPSATSTTEFKKGTIDLSAYNVEGTLSPNMSDAVVVGDNLFVLMQRLDSSWNPQQAYIAVIDVSDPTNPIEIDTDPQTDGLKGVALNAANPSALVEHNGAVYASGRGDFSADSGGLDKIDATTFTVTSVIDGEDYSEFNDTVTDVEKPIYYHITDVTVISDQLGYASLNIEQAYTTLKTQLVSFNPSTGAKIETVSISGYEDKEIKDITTGPNGKLWIGISNADNPGILVLDTDTNTINGDFISLQMPPIRIEFLDIDELEIAQE